MRKLFTMALAAMAASMTALPAAHAKLDVVATVPDLAAIAKQVGGAHVSVKSLSLETQDPHFVDAKPSLALALNKADVLLAVGLELEVGWLPTLQTGARNRDIVAGGRGYIDCSQFITPLDVPTGKVDRSKGDIHPNGNPHYLTDPRNAVKVARGIADRFAALDPSHADEYRAGYDAFANAVNAARAGWERRLAGAKGAPVVPYHKSFIYLGSWLGLDPVSYVEPKAGVSPSPKHVARTIVLGRKKKVRAIVVEAYYPSRTATLVAKKMGAKLVKLPGGTAFRKGQTYVDHMNDVVALLEGALE